MAGKKKNLVVRISEVQLILDELLNSYKFCKSNPAKAQGDQRMKPIQFFIYMMNEITSVKSFSCIVNVTSTECMA